VTHLFENHSHWGLLIQRLVGLFALVMNACGEMNLPCQCSSRCLYQVSNRAMLCHDWENAEKSMIGQNEIMLFGIEQVVGINRVAIVQRPTCRFVV